MSIAASITSKEFWIKLFQKVIKAILKDNGIRTSPPTHNQHVVPHEEGWAIKGAGNSRYSGVFEYQDDAIERARQIAINYGSSVIIHRKDGSIRDSYSYKEKKKKKRRR